MQGFRKPTFWPLGEGQRQGGAEASADGRAARSASTLYYGALARRCTGTLGDVRPPAVLPPANPQAWVGTEMSICFDLFSPRRLFYPMAHVNEYQILTVC